MYYRETGMNYDLEKLNCDFCSSDKKTSRLPAKAWMEDYQTEIDSALAYLTKIFDPTDGFPSYIAPDGYFNNRQPSPPEVFTTMIVYNCLNDSALTPVFFEEIPKIVNRAINKNGFMHFFGDHNLLAADTDCTAVGYSILLDYNIMPSSMPDAVEKMVTNTCDSGIIEVYEKPAGKHEGRIDACVLVNILHCLYRLSLQDKARPSEDYVFDRLVQKKYLNGTRYYPSPDVFLYFLSRLVRDYDKANSRFGDLLIQELKQRENLTEPFLDFTFRVAAMNNIGISNPQHKINIIEHQNANGSLPAESFFKYGSSNLFFGGEALSTAVAIRALAG